MFLFLFNLIFIFDVINVLKSDFFPTSSFLGFTRRYTLFAIFTGFKKQECGVKLHLFFEDSVLLVYLCEITTNMYLSYTYDYLFITLH